MLHRFRSTGLALVLGLPLACADKAKPDFDQCAQLEQQKKFGEARKACQLAASKDPESKAGKLAVAKLPVLATEQRRADDEQRAREAGAVTEIRDVDARLKLLKSQFEQATAKEEAVKAQLERTSDPATKSRLQVELSQASAAKEAATKAAMGSKPGCICAPSDPLCSCP